MPRNISFALTTPQFRDGSKDVTRRLGWKFLKEGDVLMACEKCQGIGPGELVRLGKIEILRVTREPLNAMLGLDNGAAECRREGFPDLTPEQFVAMFCEHMKCEPEVEITRIVFRKLGT